MPKIVDIKAYEVPDSKNEPTIQTTVFLDNNITGTFTSPSGSSVGENEALDLKNEVHGKKSVSLAISNLINIILPHLRGQEVGDQEKIDSLLLQLDNSKNKSNLGGNTLISVSGAVSVAGAAAKRVPLYLYLNQLFQKYYPTKVSVPQPQFLLLEGGLHGLFNLDFQEFLMVAPGFARIFEAQVAAKQVFYYLEESLDHYKIERRYGMEGALAPLLANNSQALELIAKAIKKTTFRLGDEVVLAMDVAASQFKYNDGYHLRDFNGVVTVGQMSTFYRQLVDSYRLLSVEDPYSQADTDAWRLLIDLKERTLIVGDDLTCTNPYLLEKAINLELINGVVIKPNQIGTITEAFQTAALAKNKELKLTASHRSGETYDTFIADFAVAIGADYLKAGGFTQKVRQLKYERLIQIEAEIYR
jgi:enolase